MASKTDDDDQGRKGDKKGAGAHDPAWANGLRQLYDSVVDEPLPDSFNDLLAQFDESDDDGEAEGGSGTAA